MTAVTATIYQCNFDGAKPFSSNGATIQLVANTALSWTVPGEKYQSFRAEFSFNNNDDIWVAYNKTALIPVSGVATDNNQQELRPSPKFVKGGDVLSFISTGVAVQCGVSLLLLPSNK